MFKPLPDAPATSDRSRRAPPIPPKIPLVYRNPTPDSISRDLLRSDPELATLEYTIPVAESVSPAHLPSPTIRPLPPQPPVLPPRSQLPLPGHTMPSDLQEFNKLATPSHATPIALPALPTITQPPRAAVSDFEEDLPPSASPSYPLYDSPRPVSYVTTSSASPSEYLTIPTSQSSDQYLRDPLPLPTSHPHQAADAPIYYHRPIPSQNVPDIAQLYSDVFHHPQYAPWDNPDLEYEYESSLLGSHPNPTADLVSVYAGSDSENSYPQQYKSFRLPSLPYSQNSGSSHYSQTLSSTSDRRRGSHILREIPENKIQKALEQISLEKDYSAVDEVSATKILLVEEAAKYKPTSTLDLWSLSHFFKQLCSFLDDRAFTSETLLTVIEIMVHSIHPDVTYLRRRDVAQSIYSSLLLSDAFNQFVENDLRLMTVKAEAVPTGVITALLRSYSYSPDSSLSSYSYLDRLESPLSDAERDAILALPRSNPSWHQFWKLSIDDSALTEESKAEMIRQNIIHEIITTEEDFVRDLRIMTEVISKMFHAVPAFNESSEFSKNTFDAMKPLLKCNVDNLLIPLKRVQLREKTSISSIGDVMLDWANQARPIFMAYAKCFVFSSSYIDKERKSNTTLSTLLDEISTRKETAPQNWRHYFTRVNFRLPRYILLLEALLKKTNTRLPDHDYLKEAIVAISWMAKEYDSQIDKYVNQNRLETLANALVWRPKSLYVGLDLNLPQRKILKSGNVKRRGNKGIDWIDSHIILLDHYFLLTKIEESGNGDSKYVVTKSPIAIDYLAIDSASQIVQSKPLTEQARLAIYSSPGRSSSKQTDGSTNSVTSLRPDDAQTLYTLTLSNLADRPSRFSSNLVLYWKTEIERNNWKDAIMIAKEAYNINCRANHAVFKLGLISNGALSYASGAPKLRIYERGTAIDEALINWRNAVLPIDDSEKNTELEELNSENSIDKPYLKPVKIYCACSVELPGKDGTALFFGLSTGLYVSPENHPSKWKPCYINNFHNLTLVYSLQYIQELRTMFMIANVNGKCMFLAYPIGALCPVGYISINISREPLQESSGVDDELITSSLGLSAFKLAKSHTSSYFNVAKVNGRWLAFHAQRDKLNITGTIHTVFRVVLDLINSKDVLKSTVDYVTPSSIHHFAIDDEFTIPHNCAGINCFAGSTVIVNGNTKFFLYNIETKQLRSIHEQFSLGLDNIKRYIEAGKPCNVFKIGKDASSLSLSVPNDKYVRPRSNSKGELSSPKCELLICYSTCAVFADRFGDIVSSSYIRFAGYANQVAYKYPHVFAFSAELLEIWDISTQKLVQVVAGRDMNFLLSNNQTLWGYSVGTERIIGRMAHPLAAEKYIIFELQPISRK
ncbi:hypothetical protein CANCADRAFT_46140 [Tortispora caseinolytica NRRL Y-17796]|uniref:DH domain-containing protein n=1 Tax=Tortispora caseinolytica NRRL Y-17796 TaxID=767744 RepID=A0A1E4TD89_9ASCO|nr:hypothetical protein CANCADRAFT_46140 [Tortispora caseinolytica NRRL Y-17796]